jgi:hypothetical protein
MDESQQFDFLNDFIEDMFAGVGMSNLSEETKNQFIPQFTAEAQRRIGLAVLPALSEQAAEQLALLIKSDDITPDGLRAFWETEVPEFQGVVEGTLREFATEFKENIAALRLGQSV